MAIAVVLLHYNRWSNLRLALRALQEQTLPLSEFYVVVADDGSTDGTVDEMRHLVNAPEWEGHLRFVSGGPHHEARISRIHNIGIANVPPECSFFLLLASDMCLAPDALAQVSQLHQQHPHAVIITRLDWLPPMTHAEIERTWDERGFTGLYQYIPEYLMKLVQHTPVGKEPRPLKETATLEPLDTRPFHPVYGLPVELFWRVGGYDEGMSGYGFQELEFGVRLQQQQVDMVTTMEIRALHIWHPKDPQVNDRVPWQRQQNTDYVLRKHGPHPSPLHYRVWNYWRHYHRDHRGMVALNRESRQLYAINEARTHFLRLPHAGWLFPLGFSTADLEYIEAHALTPMSDMGEATDPLGECSVGLLQADLETALAQRVNAEYPELPPEPASEEEDNVAAVREAFLNEAFFNYDTVRTMSDRLPFAQTPGIGMVIKIVARLVLTGRVWAAERHLLHAMLDRSADSPP